MNIDYNLGTSRAEYWNKMYFPLINGIIQNSNDAIESRAGKTHEVLNWKTIIDNPVKRCTGGFNRNINVFFLIAEAMWIWSGEKDVEFLSFFNSRMKDYSDDGDSFHAPYGFRLRSYGVSSFDKATEENKHFLQGIDQIELVLSMINVKPNTRRAVASIWNADYDLNAESKDIPCNDLLMFKVRDGKLNMTVQNRSNDLHWGLCTNVFQFSWILEKMSIISGLEVGTQVHNSDSLHIYHDNKITGNYRKSFNNFTRITDIYEHSSERQMDFNFSSSVVEERLKEVDYWTKSVVTLLREYGKGNIDWVNDEFENELKNFSEYLFDCYSLLKIYLDYKAARLSKKEAFESIMDVNFFIEENGKKFWDFQLLAANFFASRQEDLQGDLLGKL